VHTEVPGVQERNGIGGDSGGFTFSVQLSEVQRSEVYFLCTLNPEREGFTLRQG